MHVVMQWSVPKSTTTNGVCTVLWEFIASSVCVWGGGGGGGGQVNFPQGKTAAVQDLLIEGWGGGGGGHQDIILVAYSQPFVASEATSN